MFGRRYVPAVQSRDTARDGADGSRRRTRDGVGRLAAGLLDQAVVAAANGGTTVLALVLLDRSRAGAVVIALGVGYSAMYLNRALVGEVLIALSSRYEDERHHQLVRDGSATALVAGLLGFAVVSGVWWVRPVALGLDDLIWIAPCLPVVMLHDTARCGYLAARQPQQALRIDLVWVAAQAAVAGALILTGNVTPGGLLAAWGLGAAAGCVAHLARTGSTPWRGSPRRWLSATRELSGWFTATAVVGQLHLQAVNVLVAGRLTAGDLSGLRFVQTIVMQPVQNLISAVQSLLVPRVSRTAHAAQLPGSGDAGHALRRQTAQLAAGAAVSAVLFVLIVWPLVEAVLSRYPKFADVAPLALPVSIQAGIYLLQVPFTAALRGMHRARMLFGQYVVFSAVGLTGLTAGATLGGLPGAAWGLVAGSVAGLGVMVGCCVRVLGVYPAGRSNGAGTGTVRPAHVRAAERLPVAT